MIQLEKKENGKNAKVLTSYPDQMAMEIASEMLAENYRKELSEKNDNTIYIADLEQAIELGLKSEWFEGAGYYKDGECLLLDSTKSLTTIREDVYTWELVEVPEPAEEDPDAWDEFNLPDAHTKNFKLNKEQKYDNFCSDFTPDEPVYSYIQELAEKELEISLASCNDYEISGINTDKKYFVQIKFAEGVLEWEFIGELPEDLQ